MYLKDSCSFRLLARKLSKSPILVVSSEIFGKWLTICSPAPIYNIYISGYQCSKIKYTFFETVEINILLEFCPLQSE